MSNALAIASVTAVLKYWLENMLQNSVTLTNGAPSVSVNPPGQIAAANLESTQLYLFLYHVAPNIGWRNVGLPSRNDRGEQITDPPLALDLYYLLTAYERANFEAEILLGYAMQMFHETPVLRRNAIREALSKTVLVSGGTLPPSNLADQIELIKLTPQVMSIEEISKLWTALGGNYRPSVAYHASVVLIEGTKAMRSSLPVLSIGKEDGGITSQANLIPPYPSLIEAKPPREQISACLGDRITVNGYHLDEPDLKVHFTHRQSVNSIVTDPLPNGTSDKMVVQLPRDHDPTKPDPGKPDPSAIWPSGLYTLSVTSGKGKEERTTNQLALSLAPIIVSIDASNKEYLVVTFNPQMHQGQRASLILGDIELQPALPPSSSNFPIYQPPTYKLGFDASSVPAGEYLVRLRIDGVESQFIDRCSRPPAFLRCTDFNLNNPGSITVAIIP